MGVTSYRELTAYRKAFALQQHLFELSKSFPKSETYALTDQVRRASRSMGANIAEAWKKRRYRAHFISKLTDSDAELAETRHWIQTACACTYLDVQIGKELDDEAAQIGRLLGSMIRDADRWTTPPDSTHRATAS